MQIYEISRYVADYSVPELRKKCIFASFFFLYLQLMKRIWLVVLTCVMFLSAIALVVLQVVQTRRSAVVSDNLFNVSVDHSMDKIVSRFESLKVDEVVNKNSRGKLQRYRRFDDLNSRMADLIRDHEDLFYDMERTTFGVALQDSISIKRGVRLWPSDSNVINQYNTLLNARRRLSGNGPDETLVSLHRSGDGIIANDINYGLIDTLIREELIINGVDLSPQIGVVNASRDEYIYLSEDNAERDLRQSPYRYSFHFGDLPSTDEYCIVLHFDTSLWMLRANQHVFIYSSVFLILIILFTFLLSIRIIANQRKLDEMKTNFINNMTHEVKTPISTIALTCEMLRDETIQQDDETRRRFLNVIKDETRRMQVLIETILQSAKMSKKNYTIKPVELNLHSVVDDVIKSFQVVIDNRRGTINTDLQATPSTIYADTLHITNLLYNLIDNAIKYSTDAPDILISTRREGDFLQLRVSDHGIGISKENQKHIFEKFYRVSTGDVHNVKGFGIGLNYVAQVVALHRGTISVSSAVGEGTVFTITLPAV